MKSCPTHRADCSGCSVRIVCRCLQVTEEAVVEAVTTFALRTVKEVREHTGAGDGCTACHRKIRQYLEQHCLEEVQSASSAAPICASR